MTAPTEETLDAHDPQAAASSVRETIASGLAAYPGAREPERGQLVGRYVVLSMLGAGQMGVVLAAYDPELDRKVALKILKPGAGPDRDATRTRLQREAQALARIDHANVVTVHDVGVHEGQVFMAMEFVEGRTLRDWMREGPRPWPEVLEVFRAAGLGLAAAHAGGVVHRDFKPANVMLGPAGGGHPSDATTVGRVRVMDFGLARADESWSASDSPRSDSADDLTGQSALHAMLTDTVALKGTPAYMAPEQFKGVDIGPRSDQFGFCVAFFEALYGMRPFRGETAAELATAVTRAELDEPPRNSAAPRWLWPVLRRGLSADPNDRFADMPALLAALGAAQTRRRRRTWSAAIWLAGVAALGVLGYERWTVAREEEACVARGDAIDEVWNDTARSDLREALLASGATYAETAADNVTPYLDAHAEALRRAQREVCLDARVRRSWSDALYERATDCLDRRSMQLEAMIAALSEGGKRSAERAVIAAARLPPVERCVNEQRLRNEPAPPRDVEAARAVKQALSRAEARVWAGQFLEGLEIGRDALAQAEAIGSPALTAEVRVVLGVLLDRQGEIKEAEEMLEDAFFAATDAGALDVVASAASNLVFTVGYHAARPHEGRVWFRQADTALDMLGEPEDGLLRAGPLNGLAAVNEAEGSHEEAIEINKQALAIKEAALGPDHPDVAATLNNLGVAYFSASAYEDAKATHERALAIRRATLGPRHPTVGSSLGNLANIRYALRELDEAKVLYEQAMEIYEETLGPDNLSVAATLNNLGSIAHDRHEYDQSRALHEHALAIRRRVLGPEHPLVAGSLNNLANLSYAAEDFDEARRLYERSIAITERLEGHDTSGLVNSLVNLAAVHESLAEYAKAAAVLQRAVELQEHAAGPDDPSVAYPLVRLVWAEIRDGRPADALAKAERGVALLLAGDAPTEPLVNARFALAQALWTAPVGARRDRPRARELARQAADATQDGNAKGRIERWLAQRGIE